MSFRCECCDKLRELGEREGWSFTKNTCLCADCKEVVSETFRSLIPEEDLLFNGFGFGKKNDE